ncbi:unnamed protein product, partial [marine sediment metagenome]
DETATIWTQALSSHGHCEDASSPQIGPRLPN